MRHLLLFSAIIVGAGWVALTPAMATSLAEPGLSGTKVTVTSVEKVGYWRRQYRRVRLPASRLWLPGGAACLFSASVWRGGASTRR